MVAFIMISLCSISQDFSLYVHEIDDEYVAKQNYHSVLTPDGSLIMDENIFDLYNGGVDVGIKFLKISPEGYLTDSLYVDDIQIGITNLMERNSTDDGFVYVYFSRENDTNYYNCCCFSDNMKMTDRKKIALPIDDRMVGSRNFMLDSDIYVSWLNDSKDTCRFAHLNMEGEVCKMSKLHSYNGSVNRMGVEKFNGNFERLGHNVMENAIKGLISQPMSVDKKDGSLYVVYDEINRKLVTHLRCLDENLNEKWDKAWMGSWINYLFCSVPKDEGGVVLTGHRGMQENHYITDVYTAFFTYYDSTDELQISQNSFFCYPNPAIDVVNIRLSPEVECPSVEIYSLDGRLIKTQNPSFGSINVENLTSGIYIMKIRTENGHELTEHIVKE